MPTLTGTLIVPAGDTFAIVTGAFGSLPYQAGMLSASWNTGSPVNPSLKTPVSFRFDFGTPAPPGGGTLDWIAIVQAVPVPTPSDTLSSYLVRTRRLLHDLPANYVPDPLNMVPTQYYSDYDLTSDINDAIRERDLWSGGSRNYQPNIPLTIGQDTYLLSSLFPALTAPPPPSLSGTITVPAGATSAIVLGAFGQPPYLAGVISTSWLNVAPPVVSALTPVSFLVTFSTPAPPGGGSFDWLVMTAGTSQSQLVLDVINVILIYGSTRVVLENPTFTDLTIRARALVNYQNRPWGFARYGAGQIYIAPAPGAVYSCDFDLSVLSTVLVAPTDGDMLPYPYTKPVPYYAAYLAKLNQRRFDEAEVFFGFYIRCMRDIEGARVGQMVNAYASEGSRRGARAGV